MNREAIARARYMLRVAANFIQENNLEEWTSYWDEAECDGQCLLDDCTAAAEDLETLLAAMKLEEQP